MQHATLLEAFTAYATEYSDKEPQLLAQLRRETHQKVLQPRMLSGPLGRLLLHGSANDSTKTHFEVGHIYGLCQRFWEGLPPEGVTDVLIATKSSLSDSFRKKPLPQTNTSTPWDAKVLIPQLDEV